MTYVKWRPSCAKAKEYAEKMNEVQAFCDEHGIRYSGTMDSYYFTLDGQRYRVSNHTIARDGDIICFTASKTRLPEIYNALLAGKELDKMGYTK